MAGLTPHIAILNNRAAEAIDFYTAAFEAEELTRRHCQTNVARLAQRWQPT